MQTYRLATRSLELEIFPLLKRTAHRVTYNPYEGEPARGEDIHTALFHHYETLAAAQVALGKLVAFEIEDHAQRMAQALAGLTLTEKV